MPGRKQASEWEEVLISADKKTVKCIYCSSQFSKKIECVRNHLKACKWKKNAEIEEDVEKNPTEKLDLDESQKKIVDDVLKEDESTHAPVLKRQKLMHSFTVSTPKSEKEQLLFPVSSDTPPRSYKYLHFTLTYF